MTSFLFSFARSKVFSLTLLHSVLAILSAIGLKVEPISVGIYCPGKQTGSHKIVSPLHTWQKYKGFYP